MELWNGPVSEKFNLPTTIQEIKNPGFTLVLMRIITNE